MPTLTTIKTNEYNRVMRGDDGWIYKIGRPLFVLNEFSMLTKLADSGYVPKAKLLSTKRIAIQDLGDQVASWETITDPDGFMRHLPLVLDALKCARVRHGDLTRQAIIVKENKPMLIDFSESLLVGDSRPDKRPEGDAYWLERTMRELAHR